MTNHHYYVICDYVLPNKFESQVKYSNLIGWARFKTFVTCRARYNCTNMGKWQNDLFCLNRFKLVWTGSNCGYVIGCVIDYVIAALGLCRFWQCTKWYSKFEEIKLIQVSSVFFGRNRNGAVGFEDIYTYRPRHWPASDYVIEMTSSLVVLSEWW